MVSKDKITKITKELFEKNETFRDFVTNYAKKHSVSLDKALTSALVLSYAVEKGMVKRDDIF